MSVVDPLDQLTRTQCVMLWVIAVSQELVDKGLLRSTIKPSPQGQKAFEALQASGFKPRDDEVRVAIDALRSM